MVAARTAKDAFKATERRLCAIPDLREKLKDDEEELEKARRNGLKERSYSVPRFGVKLPPEEIMKAVIMDLEASIAATKEIAEKIHCDPVLVWRNRRSLVQRVAVRLYGACAVK